MVKLLTQQFWLKSKDFFYSSPYFCTLILSFIFFYLFLKWGVSITPFQDIQSTYAESTSDKILLDRHGYILQESRVHFSKRQRPWIKLEEIPPHFIEILLLAEDQRFFYHPGVDPLSILHNALRFLTHKKFFGASTLTMQLSNNLPPKNFPSQFNSFPLLKINKVQQIFKALSLERQWSKKEILETYINTIYYFGELQGLGAATRILFNKHPQNINRLESMLLVTLIRSPQASPWKINQRMVQLYKKLHSLNTLKEKDLHHFNSKIFDDYKKKKNFSLVQEAPHFLRHLLNESKNTNKNTNKDKQEIFHTTIDLRWQKRAKEILQAHLNDLTPHHVRDGAVLIVKNDTGEVLSYVASSGKFSLSPHVDGILSYRQAGSTLKPFLYGLGIDKKIFTAATLFDDSPLHLLTNSLQANLPQGHYHPQNYNKQYLQTVSLRMALASSINIPAVKAVDLLGVSSFLSLLEELQLMPQSSSAPALYGPSLALGALDVRLWDLVNAYRTLANSGLWTPLQSLKQTTHHPSRWPTKLTKKIYSPQTAFIIADILSDREARAPTFGLESSLSTPFWSAVKTGTSKDMRDNWCLGFSSLYTVGVWVGNFSGEPMWNVHGMVGAAPVWSQLMQELHSHQEVTPPSPPTGIESRQLQVASILKNQNEARREYFLQGTAPSDNSLLATTIKPNAPHSVKILYPPHQLLSVIDPDIPLSHQSITFTSSLKLKGQNQGQKSQEEIFWVLNDQKLALASAPYTWQLRPGYHQLMVAKKSSSKKWHILHQVNFQVTQ